MVWPEQVPATVASPTYKYLPAKASENMSSPGLDPRTPVGDAGLEISNIAISQPVTVEPEQAPPLVDWTTYAILPETITWLAWMPKSNPPTPEIKPVGLVTS